MNRFFRNSSTWMAVLTITGIMLAAILLSAPQPAAQAAMLNAQADFSMMTAGTNGGDEALIIVDKRSQKMVIYRLNGNSLEALAGYNLGAGPGPRGR